MRQDLPVPQTSAENLFAAAKAYHLAMSKLSPDFDAGIATAVAMPFYLLAGFCLELSCKAVILRTRHSQAKLKRLGHDLRALEHEVRCCGLRVEDDGQFTKLVDRLHPIHSEFQARYVPDVETIILPGPGLVLDLLLVHLERCENQFDVWGDD